MTETKNYKLKKPDLSDPVDIRVLNDNFDTIDEELYSGSYCDLDLTAYSVDYAAESQSLDVTDAVSAEVIEALANGAEPRPVRVIFTSGSVTVSMVLPDRYLVEDGYYRYFGTSGNLSQVSYSTLFLKPWYDETAAAWKLTLMCYANQLKNYIKTVNGVAPDDDGNVEVEKPTVYEFDTVRNMQETQSLKVGDLCATKGYHSFGDGGAAEYVIVSEVDESTHQEMLVNGLYASLVHSGVINVKQLGAYGDDLHTDTTAIQKAFNLATRRVDIPAGIYLTGSTITISNKSLFALNAENSEIKCWAESGYVFRVSALYHSTLNFGKVRTLSKTAGGCIEFHSNGGYAGYIDTHFKALQTYTNCVYIHSDTGYMNELRFFGGQVAGYTNATQSVGFRIEAQSNNVLMDGYRLHEIGFEDIDTGVYAIGYPQVEEYSAYGVVNNINIFDCRCESITTAIKTENTVQRIVVQNLGSQVYSELFDFSEDTRYCTIMGQITHIFNGIEVANEARVNNGVILPQVKNRSHFGGTDIDLTQTNHVDSAYTTFHIAESNTSLKLSKAYGTVYGVNKFKINMLGKNSNGFVIYDSDGNVICDGTNLNPGDVVEFEWYAGNDRYSGGWIGTKKNTISLGTNEQ